MTAQQYVSFGPFMLQRKKKSLTVKFERKDAALQSGGTQMNTSVSLARCYMSTNDGQF